MDIRIAVLTLNDALVQSVRSNAPPGATVTAPGKNFTPELLSESKEHFDYWIIDSQLPNAQSLLVLTDLYRLTTYYVVSGERRIPNVRASVVVTRDEITPVLFTSMIQNGSDNNVVLFNNNRASGSARIVAYLSEHDALDTALKDFNEKIDVIYCEKTLKEIIVNGDHELFIFNSDECDDMDFLLMMTGYLTVFNKQNAIIIADKEDNLVYDYSNIVGVFNKNETAPIINTLHNALIY